jgi:hypothetical protein
MITKAYRDQLFTFQQNYIEIRDSNEGSGKLNMDRIGETYFVKEEPPPNYSSYWRTNYGHYEAKHYRITGSCTASGYPYVFGLKAYPDGSVLPCSIEGSTLCTSLDEVNNLLTRWIDAGGPGIVLESPEEAKQRFATEHSIYAFGKAKYWFNQLTDEDLQKLSVEALEFIQKRVEKKAKAEARLLAKKAKEEEKAKAKEEAKKAKEEAKKAKEEAKALKEQAKKAKQSVS